MIIVADVDLLDLLVKICTKNHVRDLRLWKSEEGRDVKELEYKPHEDEGM